MRSRNYMLSLFLFVTGAVHAQSWQWAKEANSSADELTWDVSCDTASGNVYAGGYFKGNISAAYGTSFTAPSGGADGFVSKYTASGTLLWAFKIGGSGEDEVKSVATDASGNVYASGFFNGTVDFDPSAAIFNLSSAGAKEGFLAKYTTSGTLIWAVKFGSSGSEEPSKITCDPSGNVYMTGQYTNTVTFYSTSGATAVTSSTAGQINMFACKYNASGVVQWAVSGGSSKDDIGYNIVTDNSNVYITGVFCNNFTMLSASGSSVASLNANSGNKFDIFVMAFSQAGAFIWATSAGSGEDDTSMGIAMDATHVYITGTIKDDADFPYPAATFTRNCQGATDIFLACLTKSAGVFQWVSSQTGSGTGDEEANAVKVNSDGTLLVTGYFRNTLTYTPFGLTNLSTSAAKDVFLCGFSASGAILWARSAGGPGDDIAYGLSRDNLNNVFTGGEHKDAAVFGSNTLTNAGARNIFVAKYGCSSISSNIISAAQTVCSGNAPSTLTGTAPSGGSTPYSYLWKQSSDNVTWTNASGANTTASYSPPPLTANTYYMRMVSSGGYCAGTSNSPPVLITVTPLPAASNAGSDQAVCSSSSVMDGNNPSVGTGTWSLLSGSGNVVSPGTYNSAVNSLGVGTNRFIWRITNGSCPSSRDTVSIFRNLPPSNANAGNNQTICNSSAFINAVNPAIGNGSWQVHSGGSTITDPSDDNTTVTGLSTGINALVWTVSNGSCPPSTDTLLILVDTLPSVSNAGSDQAICSPSAVLNGNIPAVGTGTWSVLTGPGNILNLTVFNSAVNSLGVGNNRFIWTISNGSCPSSKDTVVITRSAAPSAAVAGNDQILCSTDGTINAIHPVIGNGSWAVVSGGAAISDPLDDNTSVTGLSTGTNTLVWTVSNGSCPLSADTLIITVDAMPSVSNAGSDQAVCSSSAGLTANLPATGTGTWSLLSGTGTIAAATSNVTTVSSMNPGSSSFVWTISNGVCPSSKDTVEIEVSPMPSAANAGNDQNFCSMSSYILNAEVPATGTGSWAVLSGGSSLSSNTQHNPAASGLSMGDNSFIWTVSSGVCPASADTITVHVDEMPSLANAGADQVLCGVSSILLTANTPASGSGVWMLLQGNGTITDPADPATTFVLPNAGDATLVWSISNGVCPTAHDTVVLHTDALPDPAFAGSDQAVCGHTALLAASAVSTGNGYWTLAGGAGVLVNAASPASGISGLSAGENLVVWSVSNGICPVSHDTVMIRSDELPSIANAGSSQHVCSDTILLSANVPQTGTGTWSLLTGTCIFSDVHTANTSATNFSSGQNNFIWTISSGVCPASADTVHVQADAKPDEAHAGNDLTVCSSSVSLSANIPVTGTGEWIILSGNANTATPAIPNAAVNDLDIGQTILRWKISNGICPAAYDDIVITRDAMPDQAVAGGDVNSDIPVVQLGANAPVTGTGQWTLVAGRGTIENIHDPLTKITGLGIGKNSFKWSIRNGSCPASTDEVQITLNPLKIPNGFSPNDDGVNDLFVIPSVEYYNNIHISIFNRWGNIVFESADYKNDWNGKSTGDQVLSDDTYYYVLEAGTDQKYNGFIILKTGK